MVSGVFMSQFPMRTQVMAAAVNTCWRRVFASPIYRACRRPYARIPWDSVPSRPARLASQTGPGDCLHQCGLKTTVLDWCNSSDIYTWTTTRRRPQPFFRVVWLLVALMHAGYGRLTSAPEQRMSWPCLN